MLPMTTAADRGRLQRAAADPNGLQATAANGCAPGQWAAEGVLRSPTGGEVTSRRASSKRTRREAPGPWRQGARFPHAREPGPEPRPGQAATRQH